MYIRNILTKCKFRLLFYFDLIKTHGKERIFFIATPIHGNLGDHAIVYAQYELFQRLGYGENIIEIRSWNYTIDKKFIQKKVKQRDVIVIDGGGSLGILWKHEDEQITDIIERFNKNRIIMFPQTCFYDDSILSTEIIKRSKQAYQLCPRLLIMLREQMSFRVFNEIYGEGSGVLAPDLVITLRPELRQQNRKGVLLCLREDKEKVLTEEIISSLYMQFDSRNMIVSKTSTVLDYPVKKRIREYELNQIWNEFASSELLITDRLHGMLFAYITQTPCLFVDNLSKKVSQVYDTWLTDCNYVKMFDVTGDIGLQIDSMLTIKGNFKRSEQNIRLVDQLVKGFIE